MKQTKRILSFVFALLMLVGALAACGNGKGPSVQTEPRTVTAGDDNPYDANGYMHPRFWTKESFENLIHFIAEISPFAQF